jgi:hypothetical protein
MAPWCLHLQVAVSDYEQLLMLIPRKQLFYGDVNDLDLALLATVPASDRDQFESSPEILESRSRASGQHAPFSAFLAKPSDTNSCGRTHPSLSGGIIMVFIFESPETFL